MAKVIKSDDAPATGFGGYERQFFAEESEEPIVEGFDAAQAEAEALPDPEEILAAARAEAEEKVREAYAEGLRRGEQRGLEEFQARAGDSVAVVTQAAEAIREHRERFLASLEPQVVGLVRYMAERVVRREWRQDETLVLRMASQALGAIADAQRVTVRVHPDDAAVVREHRSELLEGLAAIPTVTITPDDAIERGGCLVETESVVIDATLQTQLDKMIEAL